MDNSRGSDAERLDNSGGSEDNKLKDSRGSVGNTYAETLDTRLGNEIEKSGRHISGTDRVVLEMSKFSRFLTMLLMTVLLLVWKVKAFRLQEYALKMSFILCGSTGGISKILKSKSTRAKMYDLGKYHCNTQNAKSGECKWYDINECYMTNDEILEGRVSEFDFNIA